VRFKGGTRPVASFFVLSLRRSRRGAAWAVKKAIETNTMRERRTTLAERLKR